ncbi:hypothetical protein FSB73_08585 [Arachidicoccus ginsenosidivorans]|uniref:Secretin/TonB short N-terminal domain-containing protein n=1 Tax=Arachidicoccus ginsenosidivorans TaxID=496057 RepID=A0A5B8VKK1_9BACT|nr:hypothetical protein [Arachidicoccus ginsenosidivorans]QEC71713.1 hypothetical protein FSB73_08585 [Arachidicoccus ginsenosidivorans]
MTKIPNPTWRKSRHQIWLMMRFTTILMLAFSLHLSAKSSAQQVSIKGKQISVEQFIREIHRQTGYQFFFNDALLKMHPSLKTCR